MHNITFTFTFPSFIYLLIGCLLISCEPNPSTEVPSNRNISIIPQPQKVTQTPGYFMLNSETTIHIPYKNSDWAFASDYLIQRLATATGDTLRVGKNAAIIFTTDPDITHEEGYRLTVSKDKISIASKSPQGAFLGVQSLLQLMPTSVFSKEKKLLLPTHIPIVSIIDSPRFAYRGMHLDVGRHFFTVEEVKRFIDLMAIHKYNTFHWHLTEDQGWRIEIKKYPKLTEVGAFRKETLIGHYSDQPHQFDGKRYGGFYTQEDIKEVVAYAQKRFITIIPEIELPGHAQAAIAAYPELGCTGKKLGVYTLWGVSENVFCPTEETFTFLENVIDEVVALFPGEYFHIGGDECPKVQWEQNAYAQQLIKKEGLKNEFELQSYFVQRIEKMLNARGKRMIGWDEILEGGLAPNATVMSWRGMEGGIEAANEGHDVIMTPGSHCYFDHNQSKHPDEPLSIGGYLPLSKVYSFDPVPPAISDSNQHHIIGGQANLWTEYIATADKLDYMAYPRAAALAEALWTQKATLNYADFSERLTHHFERLDAYGVHSSKSFYDVEGVVHSANGTVKVSLTSNVPGVSMTYTLDGSEPTSSSINYAGPFEVTQSGTIKAASFNGVIQKGRSWEGRVSLHKAVGKPISLTSPPAEKFGSGGKEIIINGVFGSNNQFSDPEWLGFEGKDFEAVIDLGEMTAIETVTCRFFQDKNAWIFSPRKFSVYESSDGKSYSHVSAMTNFSRKGKVLSPVLITQTTTRYVKIIANRFGKLPNDHPGAGSEAWLFVGEIIIE